MTIISAGAGVIAGTVAVAVFGMVLGLLLLGIDRKFAAHMQARVGPPIRQPFIDVLKLLAKDSVVPENAIKSVFNAAPVIALASAITVLLYIPIGSIAPVFGNYGDIILVMYLLTVPALAMVAGGFASGSPYASVGAQREMVTMIAYEFPLAVVIIAVAWRLSVAGISDPFSLATISGVATGVTIWSVAGPLGIIGCILLLIVLAWVTPAELSRVPCDTPEAETELCGGLVVEYSGRNLAMFYIAGGVKTVAMLALSVAVFLPWNLSWFVAMSPEAGLIADLAFFVLKMVAVLFVSVSLIRVSMARFRINHVVTIYWGYLALIGVLALILIGADAILTGGIFV
ncbi:NADH-quinone oxidoreductase subunit H [Methanoplanus sp. FWC-SCC4]|uniref:NADH-quinone oxidoreductase subunit H n=1 Tax=Methanochimaera problematica TaxID=2609417 RepID=A0AA97FBG7_9EURY|nr:complex I subunit 1 family protein [Methanoplanus sp. FWC-SCC4]WOF16360.1 NADH-quinone oxidoreductase subunit H [Methanoplanus sp. FWC-SCC4]